MRFSIATVVVFWTFVEVLGRWNIFHEISWRGLGFDKPDADDPKKGNCAPAAPAEVYGLTGFTGTCAWVDPMNELVYVFLSNRIYPDVTNRKLNQLHMYR